MGKLGLLIQQVAQLQGLKTIVVDGSDHKLSLAKKYGAPYAINRHNSKSISEEIKGLTDGLGADIVVDCSGNPGALNDVVASCRTLGKLHMKSTHGLATPINLTDIVVREITMYSSRCGPFEKAINSLECKTISVNEMISAQIWLNDIEEALSSYKNKNMIKAILRINNSP